jgi:hypothetical protein
MTINSMGQLSLNPYTLLLLRIIRIPRAMRIRATVNTNFLSCPPTGFSFQEKVEFHVSRAASLTLKQTPTHSVNFIEIGTSQLYRSYPADSFFPIRSRNGLNKSIGMGKSVVELFSDATCTRVWRYRNCNAMGCSAITLPASASFCAA